MSYSPTLMRWMQEDPTGARYIDGLNLYQPLVSNPVGNLDPSGLQSITETSDFNFGLLLGNGSLGQGLDQFNGSALAPLPDPGLIYPDESRMETLGRAAGTMLSALIGPGGLAILSLGGCSDNTTSAPATRRYERERITVQIKFVIFGKTAAELAANKAFLRKDLEAVSKWWENNAGIKIDWLMDEELTTPAKSVSVKDAGMGMDNMSQVENLIDKYRGDVPVMLYGVNIDDNGKPTQAITIKQRGTVLVQGAGDRTIAHELAHIFLNTSAHNGGDDNILNGGDVGRPLNELGIWKGDADLARKNVRAWGTGN